MSAGSTTRKIELYSIAAHRGKKPVSYADLFAKLQKSRGAGRVREEQDRVVALASASRQGSTYYLEVDQGPRGYRPLILNTSKMQERVVHLGESDVMVSKTHVAVDVRTRVAAVEYVHSGAKAKHIERLIEHAVGRKEWKNLQVELTPIASKSFVDALDDLDAIKLASIKLTRPNPGWGDHSDTIETMGEESDANTMEIQLTARRSHSLSRVSGIVQYIKSFMRRRPSNLKAAKVEGVRDGSPGRITVKLTDHVEHRRVSVDKDSSGHVNSRAMRELLRQAIQDQREDVNKG